MGLMRASAFKRWAGWLSCLSPFSFPSFIPAQRQPAYSLSNVHQREPSPQPKEAGKARRGLGRSPVFSLPQKTECRGG